MPDDLLNLSRMDKTKIEVCSLADESADPQEWQRRTPLERLEALELMRIISYGYDPTTARLQRIFSISKLGES
jgi:hypothetical protein